MPSTNLSSYNDIGADILNSRLSEKTNVILVQTGDSVNNDVHCDDAEWWQHVGFASRPGNATDGSPSCQALSIEQSDRDICYASRDTRTASLYGALGPGETALYAAGPAGTGTALISLISKSPSNESIVIKVASTTITISQDGTVVIDATSIKLGGPSAATPVALDNGAITAWATNVGTALSGLGVPVAPLAPIASATVLAP